MINKERGGSIYPIDYGWFQGRLGQAFGNILMRKGKAWAASDRHCTIDARNDWLFYIPKRDHSPNIDGEVHLIYIRKTHGENSDCPFMESKLWLVGFLCLFCLISIIISVILSYTPLTQLQDFWASNIQVMMQIYFWSCSLFNALILSL